MIDDDQFFRDATANAARRMDEIKPDWWQHVDPIRMNIQSGSDCICGQNDLDWHLLVVDEADADYLAVTKPFVSRDCEPYWLEEIAKRMPTTAPAVFAGAPVEALA